MTIQNDNTCLLVIVFIILLTLAVPLLIRFFAKRITSVNRPQAPIPLNLTSRPCPPALGTIGSIISLILPGLAIIIFGCVGPDSQFPDGRWLPIIVGCVFILAGLQVLRVSVFRRAADGVGSSVIAAIMYLAFSAVLFWAAFSKAGRQGETSVGGIVHDALQLVGCDTKRMGSPRIGQVLFLILAIIAVIGGLGFLYRITRRNRN